MPIYEFVCSECKHRFEVTRPRAEAGKDARCPKCKCKARRVFSAAIHTAGASMGFDDMPDFGGGMGDMGGMGGGMDDFGGDFGGDF